MDRKELCEAVILSADEKKLLKEIYRHPHRKCEPEEIEALEEMGLVEEDAEKRPYFGVPIPLAANRGQYHYHPSSKRTTIVVTEDSRIVSQLSSKKSFMICASLWLYSLCGKMGQKRGENMDRKEACEQVILLPGEKRLLNRIRRNPGLKCTDAEVETLLEYDLVEPLCEMLGGFTLPVPTNRYQVSDFYSVYAAYRHRELLDYIADKWIDILASLISLLSLVISVVALMR